MCENSTIKTGVSLPTELWNRVRSIMRDEGIDNFSFCVQKGLRLYVKNVQKVKAVDYLDSLDESEMELLKKEIKKRS